MAESDQDRDDEERMLRTVALRNAETIFISRQRHDEELLRANEALEGRTGELARSLAAMRATLEATTDGILVTDLDGQVTDANEKFARMWQLPPDLPLISTHQELLGQMSPQIVQPEEFIGRIAEIYAVWPEDTFDTLYFSDGRVFERFTRIQSVDNRRSGRVWSFRDITERMRTEEALREETRVLEVLNRTGTAIASTLDLQTLVQAVTDAATQLSGARFGAFFYNTTDERGDAFQLYTLSGLPREAFERFGWPRATALFGPTFRGEGPIRCDDVLHDPRYGRMPPHHGMPQGHPPVRSFLAVPVLSRAGESIGGLFFGHPEPGVFTERAVRVAVSVAAQAAIAIDNARLYEDVKRAALEREALLEAERSAREDAERTGRMKDEFLATLSHELRTPLNAMLGWSHILLSGKSNPDDTRRGLEAIARNAKAQTRLIEDLLDMNRIVSGKVRLDVQPTDLASVIDAALDSVRPSADSKEIRLLAHVGARVGPVSGDPNRLQQIIWNLLSNAIKFTSKGGTVTLRLDRIDSHVEVAVMDTGIGIEPAFLPQVFDRFRQADSSTTRRHGGLGLGLSIVKHLVELHGGTVRADSAGDGKGASFVVSLPLPSIKAEPMVGDECKHADSGPEGADAEISVRLDNVNVLVVDDEQDARELIENVLLQSGARVWTAGTADEGLAIIGAQRPDIIVSDIGMPGKDGYEFIREVRGLGLLAGGRTPAIALTAFARSEDRTRAMIAGYQVHISKPIEPGELVATVASLTGLTVGR